MSASWHFLQRPKQMDLASTQILQGFQKDGTFLPQVLLIKCKEKITVPQ